MEYFHLRSITNGRIQCYSVVPVIPKTPRHKTIIRGYKHLKVHFGCPVHTVEHKGTVLVNDYCRATD